MIYFVKNMDEHILEALDTETMALITTIKNKLGLSSYKDTIDIICTCTDKYKLEQLLLNLMSKTEVLDE